MRFEVYFDMRNENTLYTISMLSAMLEEQEGDYYKLLLPFVLHCLPDEAGSEIDVDNVTTQMKRFGFVDFPIKLSEILLIKLCDPWKDGIAYVSRTKRNKKNKFHVVQKYDKSEFDSDNRDMRSKIEKILLAIQEYFKNNFYYKEIDLPVIKDKLLSFFELNGFTIIENTAELGLLQKENGSDSFEIAHFILEEHSKKSSIFEDLCDVTKGFLTYKGLYYFLQEKKGDMAAKFRNVTFYLDCSLVLDALNYDTDSDYRAINELVRLIRRCGGKVCVFRHTVEEASKLIRAFANQPQRRNSFRLDNLASKNYTREMLNAFADGAEETLKSRTSIETVDSPAYENGAEYRYLLGQTDIVNWLQTNRMKGNKNTESDERYHYDAKSLLAVCMLRKSFAPAHIEDAKAMIITQDVWLNWCLESLYPDKFAKELPYAITDAELVSLLWLREHKNEENIPCDLLIANAHAAARISPDVMRRATELANTMAESGDIPLDAALLVNSQFDIKQYIANCVNNDIERVDEQAIRLAIDKFIASRALEEVKEAREEEQDIARKKVTELSREMKVKKTIQEVEIRKKDEEIKALKEKIRKKDEAHLASERKRTEERCNHAQKVATNAKSKLKQILRIASYIVGIFLVLICVGKAYERVMTVISTGQMDWILLVDIIGFGSSFMLFFSRKSIIMRLINRIGDYVYGQAYSKIIGE